MDSPSVLSLALGGETLLAGIAAVFGYGKLSELVRGIQGGLGELKTEISSLSGKVSSVDTYVQVQASQQASLAGGVKEKALSVSLSLDEHHGSLSRLSLESHQTQLSLVEIKKDIQSLRSDLDRVKENSCECDLCRKDLQSVREELRSLHQSLPVWRDRISPA